MIELARVKIKLFLINFIAVCYSIMNFQRKGLNTAVKRMQVDGL